MAGLRGRSAGWWLSKALVVALGVSGVFGLLGLPADAFTWYRCIRFQHPSFCAPIKNAMPDVTTVIHPTGWALWDHPWRFLYVIGLLVSLFLLFRPSGVPHPNEWRLRKFLRRVQFQPPVLIARLDKWRFYNLKDAQGHWIARRGFQTVALDADGYAHYQSLSDSDKARVAHWLGREGQRWYYTKDEIERVRNKSDKR